MSASTHGFRSFSHPLQPCDLSVIEGAAANMAQYGCMVSAQYIKDGIARGRFNQEMACYARSIVQAAEEGSITGDQAIRLIELEHATLREQAVDLVKKVGGLAGGIAQATTGGALCATQVGCILGLPLVAHGSNNIYENGRNLLTGRSDTNGPVRRIYQQVAVMNGKSVSDGNIAYGTVNMSISGAALLRLVQKASAWKLFRYIRSDQERAYRQLGAGGLSFELLTNGLTREQIMEENKK